MFKYLKAHPIQKHLLWLLIVTIILLWIISMLLKSYTQHDQTVIVPDFSGKKVDELDTFSTSRNLRFLIIDSVYNTEKKRGTVIAQVPLPETKVKKNRIVYLTIISSIPERITMPNLKDLSLRQAQSMIETYGLKLGSFNHVASEFKDVVIEQLHRNSSIKPGTPINKGSVIDLVIGDGIKKEKVPVPYLYGKTTAEAAEFLKKSFLTIGATIYIDGDSAHSRIVKQRPEFSKNSTIFEGESIDLWFRSEKNYDFGPFLEKMKQDTVNK